MGYQLMVSFFLITMMSGCGSSKYATRVYEHTPGLKVHYERQYRLRVENISAAVVKNSRLKVRFSQKKYPDNAMPVGKVRFVSINDIVKGEIVRKEFNYNNPLDPGDFFVLTFGSVGEKYYTQEQWVKLSTGWHENEIKTFTGDEFDFPNDDSNVIEILE